MGGTASNGIAIRAKDLSKTYGEGDAAVDALKKVSFEIESGRFVVLLGPSGSGKTTLLNQVGALEEPTSGDLTAFGTDLGALGEKGRTEYRLRTVGFVFQFFNLVPTLTARENVALLAELTGSDAEKRTDRVLDQVGLADRMDHFPGEMSGGEQQRVSIARGLVKGPPLLLCDEPTGSLDVKTGKLVLKMLKHLTTDDGMTVFVVTHNSTIAKMADRVLRLRDGEICSDEVNPAPADPDELDW